MEPAESPDEPSRMQPMQAPSCAGRLKHHSVSSGPAGPHVCGAVSSALINGRSWPAAAITSCASCFERPLGKAGPPKPPPRPCGRMMACPQAQRLHRPAYTTQTISLAARDTSARGAFLRPGSSYLWFKSRHTSSITKRMLSSLRWAVGLGLQGNKGIDARP